MEKAVVSSEPSPQPQQPASAVPQGTVEQGLGRRGEGTRTVIAGTPGVTPEAAPGAGRPAWLPAKFESPEAMAAAYSELERRQGGGQPAPAAAPAQPAAGQQPAPSGGAALKAAIDQEFASTGKVSPELRQRFTRETGFDESFIDNQIAYLGIQQQKSVDIAIRRLGGEQAVSELNEWGRKNLSAEERAAFNQAVYSGNEAMATMAIDALDARYQQAVGRPPRVMAGRRPSPDHGGITPFQSNAEFLEAQKDPRYDRDPAYRAQVEDRLRLGMRMGLV